MRQILLVAAIGLCATPLMAAQTTEELARQVDELKAQVEKLSHRAPKIGVVNIVRVFDELEEKIDMNAELQQIREKHEARLRSLANRVKDLQEKAKLLRPDSEEGKKTLQELEEAKREARSYRDASEDHIYNKLFDFSQSMIKKISDEVRDYANEAGYDLVLRTRDPDLGDFDSSMPPRMRYMDLNRRIEYQNVLFVRPAFDFTDIIIKRLNQKSLRLRSEKPEEEPKPKVKIDLDEK